MRLSIHQPVARRSGALASIALVSIAALAGCAPTQPASGPTSSSAVPESLTGSIVVDAAASLTETLSEIAATFEEENPGVTVTLNFGGSSALAESIVQGAPVDVFAAASATTMATVVEAGLASSPEIFTSNSLEIVVPAGNPGQISGLSDFADPAKTIALCAPEVPCGAASAQVFAAAGITPAADTLEEDVKAALTKVRLGEVDAALVYRTDVLAAGDEVEGIEFSESAGAVTDYPIVALENSMAPDVAAAFVDFVLDARSQEVLARAGFGGD